MAMLSFRSIEQLCSQHSGTVVRRGSPSVIMSTDLIISIYYFCSAWRIQYHNQIQLLNTMNSANVYHSLLDLLRFVFLYCVTKPG